MRRRFVLAAAIAGCGGSGGGGATDAGGDVASDGFDGQGSGDQDMDGVPDSTDLCPTVADPGQVDLDGDHIGWMCDPEESVTLSPGTIGGASMHAHDYTLAGRLVFDCVSSTCKNLIFGFGAEGQIQVRSDSTAAVDAWATRGFPASTTNPFVSSHGKIQIAAGTSSPELGSIDLAHGTYSSTINAGVISDGYLMAGTDVIGVLGGLGSPGGSMTVLLGPQPTGAFASIGTTYASSSSPPPFSAWPIQVLPNEAPVVVIAAWTANAFSLARWVSGSASWAILDAGGQPLAGISKLTELAGGPNARGYCALRGGTAYFVGVSVSGVSTGTLPSSDCFVNSYAAGVWPYFSGDQGLAYLYQGVVHTVPTSLPTPVTIESVPGDIPTVILRGQASDAVWSTDATGNPVRVVDGVTVGSVSIGGTTVNVAIRRGNDVVLVRYRQGSAPVEVPVATNVSLDAAHVFTTREGAAIVTTSAWGWIVPSQATTAAVIDLSNLRGAIRGNFTVFEAKRDTSMHPTSQPAIYAYDEVAGAPRLTMLSPEIYGQAMRALDAPRLPPSDWFLFYTGPMCKIARLVVSNGAPALGPSVSCTGGNGISSPGTTSTGKIVATESTSKRAIYVLDNMSPAKVVDTPDFYGSIILDGANRVVAWTGTDAQAQHFLCLASLPDHCWTIADPMTVSPRVFGHGGSNGAPDAVMSTWMDWSGSTATIHVVKAVGPGTRPPPL